MKTCFLLIAHAPLASALRACALHVFPECEAQVLALRADLMAQVERTIRERRMTQVAASKVLGVSQSRVSDLKRGKVEKFSLDMLVTFAARLGKPAEITLAV